MDDKRLPRCPIIGAEGNIFNIFALASRTLRNNGMANKVDEMLECAKAPGNDYNMALGVVLQYVDPVGTDEPNDLNGPNPDRGYDEANDPEEDCSPGYGQTME